MTCKVLEHSLRVENTRPIMDDGGMDGIKDQTLKVDIASLRKIKAGI
jgi:hypothetical protein